MKFKSCCFIDAEASKNQVMLIGETNEGKVVLAIGENSADAMETEGKRVLLDKAEAMKLARILNLYTGALDSGTWFHYTNPK